MMGKRTFLQYVVALGFLMLFSPAALSQEITLDVTGWKGNEAEPANLKRVIELFEAEHPNIKIDFTYVSRSDVEVVVSPRLQGKNAPDLLMADMILANVWGGAGLLEDLGKNNTWHSRLLPDVKNVVTTGNNVYVMPFEVIGMGLFSNVKLLNKVGIKSHPKTVTDMLSACRKLDAAGIDPMLVPTQWIANLIIVANGVTMAGSAAPYGTGEKSFENDPSFTKALGIIDRMVEANCFNPRLMAGVDAFSNGLTAFKAQKFAMAPLGAWNIGDFSKVDGFDFVFGPVPVDNGSGVALDLFGVGWAISAKSQKKDAARKFLDFFARDDILQLVLDAESAYSPFKGGASGMPALAGPYNEAKKAGGTILWPFTVLEWPGELEIEMNDSVTGYFLNMEMDKNDVFSRWDEVVEDNLE